MNKISKPIKVHGVVTTTSGKFGFLKTTSGESYFIEPSLMSKLVHGDEVSAELRSLSVNGSELVIHRISVENRPASSWIGVCHYTKGRWLLEPDGVCGLPIQIQAMEHITPNCVVLVKCSEQKKPLPYLKGQVVAVLGPRGSDGFDLTYAALKHGFSPSFSAAALAEVSSLSRRFCDNSEEITSSLQSQLASLLNSTSKVTHTSLTHIPFITIDEESSQDLDDAVYVARKAQGGFELKVAIADVSYLISPGSALDLIAKSRATSLYLPGQVIPMFPSGIANGLCSLLPGQSRYAVVAHLELDEQGNLTTYRFERAMVQSTAKLSYSQVQQVLDGDRSVVSPQVASTLDDMTRLFNVLRDARIKRGTFAYNERTPMLVTCPNSKEPSLVFVDRLLAHQLIEECMVISNHAAALRLQDLHGNIAIFRHQPAPDESSVSAWKSWLSLLGESLSGEISMPHLAHIIEKAEQTGNGREAALMTRSLMSKASYNSELPSHFSLGFEAYTHFTSPIRRYADLLVHRLLFSESCSVRIEDVEACTDAANRARMAERYVWDRLKRKNFTTQVPEGAAEPAYLVYSSLRGIRVLLENWECSGWISATKLKAIGLTYNASKKEWSKDDREFRLGASFEVAWSALVDEKGVMELELTPLNANPSPISLTELNTSQP